MFLQQFGRLIGRDFNEQIGRARSEFARQGRCARAQLRHQAIGPQRAHNHAALSHRNTCSFRIGPNGVVGAAQTNGGQGCVESVLVLGSLTAFAAHGTTGALFKVNANFTGLRLVFVVLVGTDEGEVTEYLGCELVRDRKARTGQLIQAGYAERVLRVFNMWDCNPVATPMDPNVRLSKLDCPEVVDPLLHRKYRSIVGCLSYLVNMTRPDLAFSFSQLSKFLQYPGEAHLAAAYRVLAYVKGTLHQGLSWHDPGAGSRNKLSGWVDSAFVKSNVGGRIPPRCSPPGRLAAARGLMDLQRPANPTAKG